MKVYPIQTSFLGGEISPSSRGNVESEYYTKGLGRLENFIPTEQGSIKRRAGTVFGSGTVNPETPIIVPFSNPGGNDYGIEIGSTYIVPWSRSGDKISRVDNNLSENLIADPLFNDLRTSSEGGTWSTYSYQPGNPTYDPFTSEDFSGTLSGGSLTHPTYLHYQFSELPSVRFSDSRSFLNVAATNLCYPSYKDLNNRLRSLSAVFHRGEFRWTMAYGDPQQIPYLRVLMGKKYQRAGIDRTTETGYVSEGVYTQQPVFDTACKITGTDPTEPHTLTFTFNYDGAFDFRPRDGYTNASGNDNWFEVRQSQPTHEIRVEITDDERPRGTTNPLGITQYYVEDIATTTTGTEYNITVTFTPDVDFTTTGVEDFYIHFMLLTNGDVNFDNDVGSPNKHAILRGWLSEPRLSYASGVTDQVEFASPYEQDELSDIYYTQDPSTGQMFLFHQNHEPRVLTKTGSGWTFAAISSDADWDPPATGWSAGDYPACGTIHQSRLYFANTSGNPSGLWMSQVGNYFDFAHGGTTADNDPAYFALATKGPVRWLESLKDLLIGTDTEEYVGTSSTGVITPSDFQFNLQSAWGSVNHKPAMVGQEMIFVQSPPRRLRAMADQGTNTNGWNSTDITAIAKHIYDAGIRQVVYADQPFYQLFSMNDEGFVCLTYSSDYNIRAAYRFIFTNNAWTPTSAMVTKDTDGPVMWMVRNTNNTPTIELYSETVMPNNLHDSSVTGTVPSDGVITGLDHLVGVSVGITMMEEPWLSTGSTPDDNGEVDLSGETETWAGKQYSLGLDYTCRAETLVPEGTNPSGTGQGDKKRFNRVTLRLVDSYVPTVNGNRPSDNVITKQTGSPLNPFVDGDITVQLDGYNDGKLMIEMRDAYPCEVASVFGSLRGSTT